MAGNTTLANLPVSISDAAIRELKRLAVEQPNDKRLRIGVKGGGCAGMSYLLEFDTLQENDVEYRLNDFPLIVNNAHLIYIKNIHVDWSGGLNARGFTFTNPNASETCGCGTSFAV